MRREFTVLLRAARGDGSLRAGDVGELDDLDWGLFLDTAFRHRVAPLAHRSLADAGVFEPDSRWEYVHDALLAAYTLTRRRNRILVAEAARIVTLVQDAGIPVALRKGAYLAPLVYGDIGLRPMNDIDLFVDRAAAPEVARLLQADGFRPGRVDRHGQVQPLSRRQSVFWTVHVNNLPTLHKPHADASLRSLAVDVCFDLFLPATGRHLPADELLSAAVAVTVAGTAARVFRPEHLLLDVAAHLHKESTTLRYIERGKHQRLLQYVDLVRLRAAHGNLDWDALIATATRAGAASNVYFALANTNHLFPDTFPADVVQRLAAAGGVDEGYLREYGAVDLEHPLTWSAGDIAQRLFSAERPVATSRFPV